MSYKVPTVSGAFNGKKSCLTDRFLKNFNAAFGNIFNEQWLLAGEGEMLAVPNEKPTEDTATIEALNALLNEKDERITELKEYIKDLKMRINDLVDENCRLKGVPFEKAV